MLVLVYLICNTKKLIIIISATLGYSTKVRIPITVTTTPKTTCMHLEAPNVCVWYIVVGFRVGGHGFGLTYLTRYQRMKDPGGDQV